MTGTTRTPLVVLVHGAWHGAWCWSALQAALDVRGIASLAIDLPGHGASTLPLTDMHGDAQHVAETIDRWIERHPAGDLIDIVLVGHSYGGVVITEAALHTTHVRHLVYLTAFVPEPDESLMAVLGSMPRHDVALSAAMRPLGDGTSVLDPVLAVPALYGSCTAEVAAAAVARLSPQPMATMVQPVTGDPRASIASTYVICTLDRSIHLEHQRAMATRCTTTLSIEADHSPFASQPEATADIIESVVRQLVTDGGAGPA